MDRKNKQQDHLKTPFPAYKGQDPYIFVSYAHIDAKRVFPELVRFYNQGYNIWYDQGISPGIEWPEEIEEALEKSALFVVFISPHAVESRNVRNEIHLALGEDKPFIAIHLEETKLKYGLKLNIGSLQGILKYSMSEEDYVSQYTNAFKREGFKPSKKPRIESYAETNEILVPRASDEYIFACYDGKDEELVLPELKKLQSQGLNIKCTGFENESYDVTEDKILNCSLFLLYVTSNSINSIIVRDEISLANMESIPFFVIYLDEVKLNRGLKLLLASKESVNKYEMSEEDYIERCTNSFKRYGFKLIDTNALKTTNKDYIYVSFDVKDKNDVISQIDQFTDLGLSIEYDASEGESEESVDVLLNASLFLVFITPNSIRSNIVRDEIYLALSEDIPFIAIYLSETKMTTGLKRQLDSKLAIFRHALDENEYVESYKDAFKQNGFKLIESKGKSLDVSKAKTFDERLANEYLKEFDKLNETTQSIFDLEGNNVLIVLKDGTNLTRWEDVKNNGDVIYVSEDLSNQTDLSRKYKGLKSLKAIVASPISDEVTNMDLMFNSCDSLVEISCLKDWNTSNVESMRSLFSGCSSLEDLSSLSGWDTSKVKDMGNVFANCKSLNDLSFLKDWDVSKVTNMKSMFRGCRSITDLSGLSQWKTSKTKNMANVFDGCRALVDLSGLNQWNVSKATTMQSMFRFCDSIDDLSSLGQWNVSKVTTMDEMFKNCRSIEDLSCLNEWDISNVESREYMFEGCESIKEYPKWCMKDKQPDEEEKEVMESIDEKPRDYSGIYVDNFSKLSKSIKNGAKIIITSDIDFNEEIEINVDDLVICGNGHTFNSIGFNRFFTIKGYNIRFESLTFENGGSEKNYKGFDERTRDMDCEYRGGAIYNEGSCSFLNCDFVGNHIGNKLWYDRSRTNIHVYYRADGAAIYSSGSCILESCNFENNYDKGSGKESCCYGVTFKENEFNESKEEKDLKETPSDESTSGRVNIPVPSYRGNEPYAFISYSHRDAARVYPDIERFHSEGYNIWYDEGIALGMEWEDNIVEALENCSLFVCFISGSSLESRNVINEIKLAVDENKEIVLIYLDDVKLTSGLKLRLGNRKSILKYSLSEKDYIEASISTFKNLKPNAEPALETKKGGMPKAYDGNDPFIFINYSHRDADMVFSDIEKFYDNGYNVWYDQGIDVGVDVDEAIDDALDDCSLFVCFISKKSLASITVVDEIKVAVDENKPVVPIYLEDVELARGLELILADKQPILKYNLSEEEYIKKCISAFKNIEDGLTGSEQVLETNEVDQVEDDEFNFIRNRPFPAYDGNDQYIFMAYSHRDAERIFPDLERFHNEGYNIWYDQGLTPGLEWDEEISNAITNCSLFVVFISPNAVESHNVRSEIRFAINENKPVIGIYLEETKLKYGLRLSLGSSYAILKYSMPEDEYIEKCISLFKNLGFDSKSLSEPKIGEAVEDGPSVINVDLPDAYEGEEPYIYVSYKHKDSKIVFPVIKQLSDAGFNIWHDNGLSFGKNYDIQIAEHISNSALFVTFITKNVMDRAYDAEDYSIRELAVARRLNKKILPIYLENVELKGYYIMHLSAIQSVFKFEFGDDDDFIKSCVSAFKDYGLESKVDNRESLHESKKSDVFISYSTKDADIAMDVCNFLESNGKTCWIAPRDISSGIAYVDQIEEAIENAKNYLIIYSENSSESSYVKNEVDLAFSIEKPIVAFNIGGYPFKSTFKFYLSNKPTVDAGRNPKDSYDSLLGVLDNKHMPKSDERKSEPKKKGFMSRLFGR